MVDAPIVPFVHRLAVAALRARFAVFAAWTSFWALRFYSPKALKGDWWVFQSGARILSGKGGSYWAHYPGGPLHVYVSLPKLQVGPPAFLLTIPSLYLPEAVGRAVVAGVLAAAGLLMMFLAERIGVRAGAAVASVRRSSLVGGVLILPLWCTLGVAFMHLDDVLVLLLVEVALLAALSGQRWVVGLALGCAIATKPWAISFAPLIAMLPTRAGQLRAGLLAGVTVIAWWLPFVIAAPATAAALSDVNVPVEPMSLWALLGAQSPPAAGREIQLALAMAACALIVRQGRWWAAPVVATAVRLALDWQSWSYYGAALVVCALLFDLCESDGRRWPRVTACALLAALVVPIAEATAIPTSLAAVVRLALLAVTAALAVGHRGSVSSRPGIDTLRQNATANTTSSADRVTIAAISAGL
jgi:hypothetical protein